MKKIIILLLFLNSQLSILNSFSQPTIQWEKCYGGSGDDEAYALCQTNDGGYIVAGHSNSLDGQITNSHGGVWVVKLDANGLIQWEKTFGGSVYDDWAYCILQANDGGYIVGGYTGSSDGDVVNPFPGSTQCWVVKLNDTGAIQWSKCYGGSVDQFLKSIIQTNDGGFIFSGDTDSNDGDVSGNHSSDYDTWVVKLNDTGAIQWSKCYGGTNGEVGNSIQKTNDGGYIVAGLTTSNDGDVTSNHGDNDYWVFKIDSVGHLQWQKSYGGSGTDVASSIVLTNDGGYAIAGLTTSNDGDVTGYHGGMDYWVVKLNDTGAIQWQKCLGGSDDDDAYSIIQSSDGNFVVAGYTLSTDGDVIGNLGANYWIIKLDTTGNVIWKQCFGGYGSEEAISIIQSIDGGLVIAGLADANTGEVTGYHGGPWDYWVVKLNPYVGIDEVNNGNGGVRVYPNPVSETLTIRNLSPAIAHSRQAKQQDYT